MPGSLSTLWMYLRYSATRDTGLQMALESLILHVTMIGPGKILKIVKVSCIMFNILHFTTLRQAISLVRKNMQTVQNCVHNGVHKHITHMDGCTSKCSLLVYATHIIS